MKRLVLAAAVFAAALGFAGAPAAESCTGVEALSVCQGDARSLCDVRVEYADAAEACANDARPSDGLAYGSLRVGELHGEGVADTDEPSVTIRTRAEEIPAVCTEVTVSPAGPAGGPCDQNLPL